MEAMPDDAALAVDQLSRSLAAVERLIAAVRPDQWDAPTPCDEWSVRRLVGHLVGMNLVFASRTRTKARCGSPATRSQKTPGQDVSLLLKSSRAVRPRSSGSSPSWVALSRGGIRTSRCDEYGSASLVGHRLVVRIPVVVGASGSAEDVPE
ncbi:MAG TPA: maleylpyruvate isomerase family mycothiol-dependent enzyme [Mycobacteriales bacterium]|nr:maleylpyruvate isomerase family mycothiol-dependent enzyme [Mycobacteriales bacterium]